MLLSYIGFVRYTKYNEIYEKIESFWRNFLHNEAQLDFAFDLEDLGLITSIYSFLRLWTYCQFYLWKSLFEK